MRKRFRTWFRIAGTWERHWQIALWDCHGNFQILHSIWLNATWIILNRGRRGIRHCNHTETDRTISLENTSQKDPHTWKCSVNCLTSGSNLSLLWSFSRRLKIRVWLRDFITVTIRKLQNRICSSREFSKTYQLRLGGMELKTMVRDVLTTNVQHYCRAR